MQGLPSQQNFLSKLSYFFLICNSGTDVGPLYTPLNLYTVSLQFNTVKFEHINENYLLGEINYFYNFCSVQFRGDFYVIKQEFVDVDYRKLTLHKISKNKRVVKITEDFITVSIRFDENSKICSRGIYKDEEDRIIFCSSEASRTGSAPL